MIAELHELMLVCKCKVRAQPAGSTAVNAKTAVAFETADEDVMVDGIKGCRKVKANQHSSLLLVEGFGERYERCLFFVDDLGDLRSKEPFIL